MARPSPACLGLLLLFIGQAAAGPEPNPLSRASRSSACQDHTALHDRLDTVEKRMEDTVLKLEAELAVLLDAIEGPEWSPLLDAPGAARKPVIDILDENSPGLTS